MLTDRRLIFARLVPTAALFITMVSMPVLAETGPFEPDEHTLLLAHFDDDVHHADYAQGMHQFAGNGASLVEGYYGKAIDLRARGLTEDFMNRSDDYTPRYDGWGFHGRGNIEPTQGTFECWFKPADANKPRMLWSTNFLNAELGRNVPHPDREGSYIGFGLTLNHYGMRYHFPTLAGNLLRGNVNFAQIEDFGRYLDPDDWHHFAMTWSQGELVVYIDGRVVVAHDMTDELGLVLIDNPVRYLSMADCIIDELRISRVVRYADEFEPRWRDGERPDYAFTGDRTVERYDARLLPPPTARKVALPDDSEPIDLVLDRYALRFDQRSGQLIDFKVDSRSGPASSNGLMLHRGLERDPVTPRGMADLRCRADRTRFTQHFEGNIVALHELKPKNGTLRWRITLINESDDEAWLEPLLSLPAPLETVEEMFDGTAPRRNIPVSRHRDVYAHTLPFVAATDDRQYLGVGIDPHVDLSDIVSQWIPVQEGGIIRQGTKVALSPGEQCSYDFVVVAGDGAFGTLDAIDAFHAQFPELYRLLPDVTVFTYMPKTQYWTASKQVDMKRLGYAGNFWGHGPGHDKGDEFVTPEWWNNPKFDYDDHYRDYARRIQQLWGTPAQVREYITQFYRQSYENWYPVRRFHTCPDVTPLWIINELWPEYTANEDPWCFGQYYKGSWDAVIVNEYNTPLGAHFREHARRYFYQTNGYCHGFINDMSHAGALYRHNDPIAQRTTGRSFSRDLGTFIRKAIGRRQRYEDLNRAVIADTRITYWSDGGAFSYTLGAFSAGMAIEGAGMYKDLTGPAEYIEPARYLIGEKPFGAMTHINDDWIGYYLDPDEFTPKRLRDYYRYAGRQLVLYCLKTGTTLDPGTYMWGRQYELEMAPLMVDAAVRGRKIVPAARVREPLWVRRNGDGLDTLLIVGNTQPRNIETDVEVLNRYYNGAPLFVGYFGGGVSHSIDTQTTIIESVGVPARDAAAFRAVGMLEADDDATVETRITGDGLRVELTLTIDAEPGAALWLNTMAPLYVIEQVRVNGERVRVVGDEPVHLSKRRSQLVVIYRNRAIDFDADAWAQVELIKDGRVNFCLIADEGTIYQVDPEQSAYTFTLGYEHGTARMLNDFLEQYDSEDGRLGTLGRAPYVEERPSGYTGWAVELAEDPMLDGGRVALDPSRRVIRIAGPTQGEMRRAMVVFMRLVDRKYPHVGRFFPLRNRKQFYDPDQPVPFDKWVLRQRTREFYEAFEDQKFLVKPVLRAEYESLYADGRMNFAGQYELRRGPFVVEPTYGDNFVYGYSGSGTAASKEQLMRRAGSPEVEEVP